MLKNQLMAMIPMNTAQPIVKIIAVPNFFMTNKNYRVTGCL